MNVRGQMMSPFENANPQLRQQLQSIAAYNEEHQPITDPWRDVDGVTNYAGNAPLQFAGRVMDISDDGIRVKGVVSEKGKCYYAAGGIDYEDRYSDFWIEHFPYNVVNDSVLMPEDKYYVWPAGAYRYSTVNGGSRTIPKYDYGIPCDVPPELVAQAAARQKAILDGAKKKSEENKIRAFQWLLNHSTNGSDGDQYALAKCYLNGSGCESNRVEAIKWLTLSANAGNIDASNKLASLTSK